jgi:hypothetical protein
MSEDKPGIWLNCNWVEKNRDNASYVAIDLATIYCRFTPPFKFDPVAISKWMRVTTPNRWKSADWLAKNRRKIGRHFVKTRHGWYPSTDMISYSNPYEVR